MILPTLAAFLCATVFLGFRAGRLRREGLEDYLLAGRTLTLPSFVATLVPSFFGGVLGVGEYTYRYGINNWVTQGLPYYFFGLLYAWLLVPRMRPAAGRTIPDHFENVYGRTAAVVAAFWVLIVASPASDLLILGVIARWLTGLPLALCLTAATAVSLSFLVKGGLRSDVGSNRLQFLVMYGGFAVIVPFAWKAAGGAAGLSRALPPEHLDWKGGNSPGYILTWFFIAFQTFLDPSFHQRVCAAKDVRTARLGIVVSVAFWFLFDLMTTASGLCSRALLPDLTDPMMAFPELAVRLLPQVAQGLFFAGLVSSTLAALEAGSFISATTLAKDIGARLWQAPAEAQELWVRWGLLAAGGSSILLALAFPSVVSLWYAIGSAAVPGLLVPLLSCYFEPLRVSPRGVIASSAIGGSLSLAWLIYGHGGAYPFGIEPFYPGLAASLSAWALGRRRFLRRAG